jgi:hypothetical protein
MNISSEHVFELALKTAAILKTNQSKLKRIEWTRGEANLDDGFSALACACCVEAWEYFQTIYPQVTLTCVAPDIQLVFTDQTTNATVHKKIELKSSKSSQLPGSTISALDINQPLIYCLRPQGKRKDYDVRCSLYHMAMQTGAHDLFQDRTPRPMLNFNSMTEQYIEQESQNWIDHYAQCAVRRINSSTVKPSWQDTLTTSIIEEYLKTHTLSEIESRKKLI